MRLIRDVIRDQILPSTEGLCEIYSIYQDGKAVIAIKIFRGNKLYYIKKEGRSATGSFYRDGTSSTPMSEEEIEKRMMYSLSSADLLKETPASYAPLSFRQLKLFYNEIGMTLKDDTFLSNLGLLTKNGKYNKIAELLSDKNHIGLIYARFDGKDKSSFNETVDFGNQCILTAVEKIMYRLEAENRGITKITSTIRKSKNLVDIDCLREAIYNAIAHNDWLSGGVPSIYVYEDRIEIMSYGGLPLGQTTENFFKGISKPRSECLMRILRDLDFAERTGHGIPKIVDTYGTEAFAISKDFILVNLPYDQKIALELYKKENRNEQALLQNEHPKLKNEQALLQNEHPNFKNEHPKLKNEHPNFKNEQALLQNEHPKLKNEQAFLQNEHPKLKNEHPKLKNEHPKLKNEHPKVSRKNREKFIIEMIKENPYIDYDDIAKNLNISNATTRRIFSALRKKGIIIRSRRNQYDKWELKEK